MSPIFNRIVNIAKTYLRNEDSQSNFDDLSEELRKIIAELNQDKTKQHSFSEKSAEDNFFDNMPHDFSTKSGSGNKINPEVEAAFRTLEISPDSTNEEIKSAFKKKIRQFHPDMQRNADAAAQARAAAVTRDLITAFNVLKKERNL